MQSINFTITNKSMKYICLILKNEIDFITHTVYNITVLKYVGRKDIPITPVQICKNGKIYITRERSKFIS